MKHTKDIAIALTLAGLIALTATTTMALRDRTPDAQRDAFTTTPRTPCAMRSQHDVVQQERNGGTTTYQIDNPDYCQQPVCKGAHHGALLVRYSNKELLRTGSTTLDIATDDGSPLGMIGIGVVNGVQISPSASLYSPDTSARFTLTGSPAVSPDQPYGSGFGESTLRQVSYPLFIDIQAWCGQHTYKITIEEKLKLYDTITKKTTTR